MAEAFQSGLGLLGVRAIAEQGRQLINIPTTDPKKCAIRPNGDGFYRDLINLSFN